MDDLFTLPPPTRARRRCVPRLGPRLRPPVAVCRCGQTLGPSDGSRATVCRTCILADWEGVMWRA